MAFPASQQTLADALGTVNATANKIKSRALTLRNTSVNTNVARYELLDLQKALNDAVTTWNTAAAIPGLAAYAQAQFNNATLDVAAEFSGMVNAAISLRDWIFANFPKDAGSGAVLTRTVAANGTVTELVFTPAELAQFRTRVDTFAATIG